MNRDKRPRQGKPKPASKSKPRGKIIKRPDSAGRDSQRRGAPKEEVELKPKAKAIAVLKGFSDLWSNLFSSPIHLDSALSKLSPQIKTVLAQILPVILLRPASSAEALGVGITQGEPWSLDNPHLAQWRPAQLIAERMYSLMAQGIPLLDPMLEDFPDLIIQELEKSWGKEVLYELIDTLGREGPLSLRASRKVGAHALLTGLKNESKLPVRAEISNLTPLGVRLSGYAPVLGTEWYQKGAFEIQDEGSQLMALFALWPERYGPILQDRPGKVRKIESLPPPPPKDTPVLEVVDACAGAGGKSLAIADVLKGKGRVFAYDTAEKKLQALRRRATHAGLNNIQTVIVKEGNETEVVQKFKGTANVVLVDAPCSGWGVLRRNPDIKWRQSPDVLTRMPEIQLRLLTLYSELVVPGGRLVFGVCTFRMAETIEIVRQFSEKNPSFVPREGGFLGPGPCDGFFMQAFERVKE